VIVKIPNLETWSCPICGDSFSSGKSLGVHRGYKHKEVSKISFWKQFYDVPVCECECGCGRETSWTSRSGFFGYERFVVGHNFSKIPWNKGLSKKKDERVAALSVSKITRRRLEGCEENIRDFSVEIIDKTNAKTKIINNHYTKSCPSSKYSFGLVKDGFSYAVAIFSSLHRQNQSGEYPSNRVLELSRLFIHDGVPKNSGSYFLSRCLSYLKDTKDYDAVLTYADTTEGHDGGIYKAANFEFIGNTKVNYHYVDEKQKRIHKKTVWDKAKRRGEKELAFAEKNCLLVVKEEVKRKFMYRFKR
jgi:hypothetical protein